MNEEEIIEENETKSDEEPVKVVDLDKEKDGG